MYKNPTKCIFRIIKMVAYICVTVIAMSYFTYYHGYHVFRLFGPKIHTINATISSTESNIKGESVTKVTDGISEIYNTFPKAFQKRLKSWTILFVSVSDSNAARSGYSAEAITGYTMHYTHTVTLINKPKSTKEDYAATYAHEMGHVFAIENGYIDVGTQFTDLYTKYKDVYEPFNERADRVYIMADSSEFFAEVFAAYYLYQTDLKQQYPELYTCMTEIIDNFKKESSFGYRVKTSVVGEYRNIAHRIEQKRQKQI